MRLLRAWTSNPTPSPWRSSPEPAPYVAYLVFPRWAETGLGIVGHLESEGRSRDEVQDRIHALPLTEVKRLLDEAIQRKYGDA